MDETQGVFLFVCLLGLALESCTVPSKFSLKKVARMGVRVEVYGSVGVGKQLMEGSI